MVRIAKIKFNRFSKEYDYICDDININEGDVVYVEGSDRPVYVYEIAIVDINDTKAKNKVIGIAIENPNVTIANRYANIINCKYTCIVNSLEPDTNIFSSICKSIVDNAKSNEIDNMLKEHPKANIYDTFITNAGNLASKYIIHIVLPFKKSDKYNENLRKAFEKVIDLAIKNEYDTIAIPFIGTGNNGYSKNDIHEALDDTLFKYQYKQNIKINIISINYNDIKAHNDYIYKGELNYNQNNRNNKSNIRENYFKEPLSIDEILEWKECQFVIDEESKYQIGIVYRIIGCLYNESDEFELDNVNNPLDFLLEYRKKKGYFETEAVTGVFGEYDNDSSKKTNKYKDVIKNIKKGKRIISKYETYRIAMALKLNFTEIIQFMSLSGFSFGSFSKDNIDYEVFNFIIHNNGFSNEYCDPEEYFSNNCAQEVYDILFGNENLVFIH